MMKHELAKDLVQVPMKDMSAHFVQNSTVVNLRMRQILPTINRGSPCQGIGSYLSGECHERCH